MRTFKTKAFTRFADKAGISDAALCRAVRDAERGLVAADLGGGVIKQRIARPGQGKSGGYRTLIVFRVGTRAIVVHGFAKNEKDNVGKHELVALKRLAAELLAYDDRTLARVIALGVLVEVNCDEKAVP
ncbi:MAG TPA: type II toxin-antitoxin system RelE/ParE family toxin [Bryobacteraceae bacterium]